MFHFIKFFFYPLILNNLKYQKIIYQAVIVNTLTKIPKL